MFLRQIQMRGFKSFADKTILEFVPGVSVIVGPNGSGKSNLVDAISWALGEQGPRALRGGQMADVIFAGSPGRPALGMAEVKLVIDNAAGLIPVPMSEIEVSRTIFRSGESEYRIGGQLVRLLDVQELLSETGIGRALHTVVGQGQLEEVLMSRPEERRKYIEEAAGIAKHRRRKERAERKLTGLDQDILRLQDVLSELRRQLKPLKQQAEMAKRHEQLTAQAEELARSVAAARLAASIAERDRRLAGWEAGLEERRLARARLDGLDAEVIKAQEAREISARALSEAERQATAAAGMRTAADRAFREAVDDEAAAREELASHAARTARMASLDQDLERARNDLAACLSELDERERELESAERTFLAGSDARRSAEDARRMAAEESAARRAEAEALSRSLAQHENERERLVAMIGSTRARIQGLSREEEELSSRIEELDSSSSPLSERRISLAEERRPLVEKLEGLEDIERRQDARRTLLEARRRDIEETPGSRFYSEHRGRAIGLLRDLIQVEPALQKALSSALGPLADAVVYDDGEVALADAPDGEGAILAVASGGPVPQQLPGERALLSAVRAEPAARGLAATVLRDVYLAGSIDEAARKQREHPRASFVTAQGVMVGPAVIHTAEEADERAREIRAELAVVAHDLSATRATARDCRERLAALDEEIASLNGKLEAADAEITSAAEVSVRLQAELSAARREEELLSSRLSAIDGSAQTWRERLSGLPSAAAELPELPPQAEPPLRARVVVESLRRERASLDQRLSALQTEKDSMSSHDQVELEGRLARAETARLEAERAAADAEAAASEAEARRAEAAERERAAAGAEVESNRSWREASAELDRLREAYEDEDRLRGDIERRVREAERLLREGHSVEPADALAALDPDATVDSLEKKAELVQRRLALLGRVNLLATGELGALEERHDFLQRELEDVRKARRDLLELIGRVGREITEIFEAAYRDVAHEFQGLIAELFPGGEGRLQLTDPSSPLESGIEIEASPGRKRVKRISLLSGGERALTAMAFLFAIFKARPSPFYLMDEVEPALDDVNLHRFLRLVEGFASSAQVIIVTHQKRTMEIAGMMYGVSMSKDGTSKVVCQTMAGSQAPSEDVVDLVEVPGKEPVH